MAAEVVEFAHDAERHSDVERLVSTIASARFEVQASPVVVLLVEFVPAVAMLVVVQFGDLSHALHEERSDCPRPGEIFGLRQCQDFTSCLLLPLLLNRKALLHGGEATVVFLLLVSEGLLLLLDGDECLGLGECLLREGCGGNSLGRGEWCGGAEEVSLEGGHAFALVFDQGVSDLWFDAGC